MADGTDPEGSRARRAPGEDDLGQLKELLLDREREELRRLEHRLDTARVEAEEVGEVLPDAVSLRSSRDEKLSEAMTPSVERAIERSVRSDPSVLAQALFPVMGPAIRKAIAEALRGMIASFNQVLERSLSMRSVGWRLEALRTGKPFAEIALIHSVRYRVEQVFLIHRESGLLLKHVADESVRAMDADMVSGMLTAIQTAIQDFVHDSFGTGAGESLGTVQVGETDVWIEQGPSGIVACVIRGSPPPTLRPVMQTAIEQIHRERRRELETFEGDVEPFETTKPQLESCLKAEYLPTRISPLLYVLPLLLLLALGWWGVSTLRERRLWHGYVEALEAEPGLVVTEATREDGKYRIAGLRDPLAADPRELARKAGVPGDEIVASWKPYYALDEPIVLRRAREQLAPPETVTLDYEGGVLRAQGTAPRSWIEQAGLSAPRVAGVESWAADLRVDSDASVAFDPARVEALKRSIEAGSAHFPTGSAEALDAEALGPLAAAMVELLELAERSGKPLRVEITGHADSDGTDDVNRSLSLERAEAARAALVARGVAAEALTTRGVGTSMPLTEERTEQDKARNRRISFRVLPAGAAGDPPP